jgi:hypothetical protein
MNCDRKPNMTGPLRDIPELKEALAKRLIGV